MLRSNSLGIFGNLSRNLSSSAYAGALSKLPPRLQKFIQERAELCLPDNIHICDGSTAESNNLINTMRADGMIYPLKKYDNCWIVRTDPADVARVESKTYVTTTNRHETVSDTPPGVKGQLANYMTPADLEKTIQERFPGCMKGRTMYVIPFSMGPVGSPLSKIGIELTDSAYVVSAMRIMTRMGANVLETLGDGDFIRCMHSIGAPLPLQH